MEHHVQIQYLLLAAGIAFWGCTNVAQAEWTSNDPPLDSTITSIGLDILHKNYIDSLTLDTVTDIRAFVNDLDPFSYYSKNNGSYTWLDEHQKYWTYGCNLCTANRQVVLTAIEPHTPLADAGVLPGDILMKVNGQDINGSEKKAREIVHDEGGGYFTLHRPSTGRTWQVLASAVVIDNPCVTSIMLDSVVGYIRVDRFASNTADLLEHTLDKLSYVGMRKVIVDLRFNSGGYVAQAIGSIELFTSANHKTILSQVSRTGMFDGSYATHNAARYADLPMVVLVSNSTCSAAEFFAGTMQDLDRALIIGEPTYGKSLIMRYFDLPNGDEMYLAIARGYLPSGRSIQKAYGGPTLLASPWRDFESADNRLHQLDSSLAVGPCESYSTIGGRTVLSNEGIIPDVLMHSDLDGNVPDWVDSAIWNVAIRYVQRNIKAIGYSSIDRFAAHWHASETEIDKAINLMERADTSLGNQVTAEFASEVPEIMKRCIASYVWIESAELKIWIPNTPIVRRARMVLAEVAPEVRINGPYHFAVHSKPVSRQHHSLKHRSGKRKTSGRMTAMKTRSPLKLPSTTVESVTGKN